MCCASHRPHTWHHSTSPTCHDTAHSGSHMVRPHHGNTVNDSALRHARVAPTYKVLGKTTDYRRIEQAGVTHDCYAFRFAGGERTMAISNVLAMAGGTYKLVLDSMPYQQHGRHTCHMSLRCMTPNALADAARKNAYLRVYDTNSWRATLLRRDSSVMPSQLGQPSRRLCPQ